MLGLKVAKLLFVVLLTPAKFTLYCVPVSSNCWNPRFSGWFKVESVAAPCRTSLVGCTFRVARKLAVPSGSKGAKARVIAFFAVSTVELGDLDVGIVSHHQLQIGAQG